MATAGTPAPVKFTGRTFLDCLRHFVSPAVWKQAHQAEIRAKGQLKPRRRKPSARWSVQPLVMTLVLMTWCTGDSQPEKFESAKAFYVATHGKRKRPGKTVQGFQKALSRLPMRVLRGIAAAVRSQITRTFGKQLWVHGFIPIGCDGSRLECPRAVELENHLGQAGKEDSAPTIWLTALVHLGMGIPWAWRWGKGTASERGHLIQLLALLPVGALLICDAGYVGFELAQAITKANVEFLIRMSSKATLYTETHVPLKRFREGIVYYWPDWAKEQNLPPVKVRLLRVRPKKGQGKHDVWLLTNVMDPKRLRLKTAAQFYRWRWGNEGLFRTYKHTLGKVKLHSRSVRMIHREAEGSMLALQLLLAQTALAMKTHHVAPTAKISARKAILEVRREISITVALLGPRQHADFVRRLSGACCDQRKRTSSKVAREWPRRKPHKPPLPPRILTLTTKQKDLIGNHLPAT